MAYKWTIRKISVFAKQKGGLCLSKRYVDSRTKLIWQCNKGHTWKAVWDSVRRGSWCLQCRPNHPLTIKDCQNTAKERGGKCLSKEYINVQTKLKWKCQECHVWWATPNGIRSGKWCKDCNEKEKIMRTRLGKTISKYTYRYTIADAIVMAKKFEGKCLSKEYKDSKTSLKWQCKKGHTWEDRLYRVKKEVWCPVCRGIKLSLEHMYKKAKERGGKCLSNKYINDQTHLKWQCANGHTWDATPNNIRFGKWCPECSSSRNERIVRAHIEQIFLVRFPISYPKWLREGDKKTMQLDGYNE